MQALDYKDGHFFHVFYPEEFDGYFFGGLHLSAYPYTPTSFLK